MLVEYLQLKQFRPVTVYVHNIKLSTFCIAYNFRSIKLTKVVRRSNCELVGTGSVFGLRFGSVQSPEKDTSLSLNDSGFSTAIMSLYDQMKAKSPETINPPSTVKTFTLINISRPIDNL
jgi:hypothetical protein